MDVRVCAVREWIAVRVCGRAGGASAGAGVLVCNGHVEEHDRGLEMRFGFHTSDMQKCVLSSGLFIPRRRFLVYSWTWGMSLPLLQKIAAKAAHDVEVAYAKGYEDGLAHNRDTSPFFQDLAHLEHLGDDGKYPGNMQKDLVRHLVPHGFDNTCALSSLDLRPSIEMQERDVTVKAYDQTILCPHAVFAQLYHRYPDQWRKHIVSTVGVLRKFWDDVAGHRAMRDHPIKKRADYRSLAVAVRTHGDGIPITGVGKSWGKSMDIFSWSPRLDTYIIHMHMSLCTPTLTRMCS